MLQDYQVPSEWWGEACAMAVFILNRTPSSAVSFQTPVSQWSSLPTDLSHLHPFRCLAVMHISKERQTSKVNPMGVLCMLVGLTKTHQNYCLFNPLTKKIYVLHDCNFLDGEVFWPNFFSSTPSCLCFPSSADPLLNCALNSPVAAPALESFESATISGASETTPVTELAYDEIAAPVLSPSFFSPHVPSPTSPIVQEEDSQPCF
ncbi:hypothetical protein O181_070937 [Austropuccinia psidii MF-1]|uniref:Retroviral polymerase SH3-like domain-containing protein n=1 Tax=Austropuccinia psidii MF-1 TaxID=1389203 RepID=A0A9Q3I8S1_9BASI|nr:hypothetical protein [Austropuccinia psidii MF-1]